MLANIYIKIINLWVEIFHFNKKKIRFYCDLRGVRAIFFFFFFTL